MRSYVGPLLDPSVADEDFDPHGEPLPCESETMSGWGHSAAIHRTISALCLGQRVTLTRRLANPSREELPGVVTGEVMGVSHQRGGRILLGVELDDGEVVAVNVSNPADWHWEVG